MQLITTPIASLRLITLFFFAFAIAVTTQCSKDNVEVEDELEGDEGDEGGGEEAAPKAGEASEELAQAEASKDEEVVEDSAEENSSGDEDAQAVDADAELAQSVPEVPTETVDSQVPVEAPPPPAAAATEEVAPTDTATADSSDSMSVNSVKYVRNNGVKIVASPASNGKIVRNAEKGDHLVVISIQNGWAQLDSGYFIADKSLSAKPVGRAKGANPWKSK